MTWSVARTWSGVGRGAWLLVMLGSLSAAAAEGLTCEQRCTAKASEPVAACMNRCPDPTHVKTKEGMKDYKRCAEGCTEGAQHALDRCNAKCAKPGSKPAPAEEGAH